MFFRNKLFIAVAIIGISTFASTVWAAQGDSAPEQELKYYGGIVAGVSMPQFDSPRTRFTWGISPGMKLRSDLTLAFLVKSAEKSADTLGIHSEARETFIGFESNYFPGGNAEEGFKLGMKLGWVRETGTLQLTPFDKSETTTNDLFVGPSIGYESKVLSYVSSALKNFSLGVETSTYVITQGSVAFYPEAVITLKHWF